MNEAERSRTKYPDAPRSIAVREAPLQLLPVISEDGPIEGSVPKSIAHVGDWRSVTKLPEQSVLDACISLEPLLSEQGVVSDNETINSLTIGDDWDAHVLLVAMPIWTVDQEHAVIFARKSTGGLSGVGILAIYSKGKNGNWQFAREEVRSIS
ncbi:hypothetical protein [Qipengyuania gelatinilytica]|uniref:Uncharacterized protein n=1 Tax=Qipengyuania gelatinilytica TaxID=2867231 RepID=A0ABX9A3M1_9SPHN|nr:hypothetical protein [Qipengyuania gelatinilytica]QZD95865.1 hypothetical protein K3136_03895 [Qipengyuania gelatinilytica]